MVAVSLILTLSFLVEDQTDRFDFQPEKIPVGTVYHYLKSNQDGTRPGNISLYVATKDRIISFKHHRGGRSFSYITADVDWEVFSFQKLESAQILADGSKQVMGSLEFMADDGQLVLNAPSLGMKGTVEIPHVPFDCWDFDFSTLNFMFRHRIDPEEDLSIGVVDPTRNNNRPGFAFRGAVDISFLGEEQKNDVACRKYSIDGPGLENRGGFLWVSKAAEHVVELEIGFPDEPGYKDVRLRLDRTENMTPVEWQEFIKAQF